MALPSTVASGGGQVNAAANIAQKKNWTPEKVMEFSPVRTKNFETLYAELQTKLSETEKDLLNAVYTGDLKAVQTSLTANGDSVDILSPHIKGMNLLHIAAARVPKTNDEAKQVGKIIDFLVRKKLNPLSQAEITVRIGDAEETLHLSPIFFTNKSREEDPELKTQPIFIKLLDLLGKGNLIEQIGYGFTLLGHEMSCTGREDLYKIATTSKIHIVSPIRRDNDSLDLGEFLQDNYAYFHAKETPDAVKKAHNYFANVAESALKERGTVFTSRDEARFVNRTKTIIQQNYKRLAEEQGIFAINDKENGVSYARVFLPEEIAELREQDPNIPEDAAIGLVTTKRLAKNEPDPHNVLDDNMRQKIWLDLSGQEAKIEDSLLDEQSKADRDEAKAVAKDRFENRRDGEDPKIEENAYLSGNVIFLRNNDNNIANLGEQLTNIALAAEIYVPGIDRNLVLDLMENDVVISPIISRYHNARTRLTELSTMDPPQLHHKINTMGISELKAVIDVAGPRMTTAIADLLDGHRKTAIDSYLERTGRQALGAGNCR